MSYPSFLLGFFFLRRISRIQKIIYWYIVAFLTNSYFVYSFEAIVYSLRGFFHFSCVFFHFFLHLSCVFSYLVHHFLKLELEIRCSSLQRVFYRSCRRQEGLRRGFFPRWDPFHDFQSGSFPSAVSGGGAMEADVGGSDRSWVVCPGVLSRVRRGAWFLACQSMKKTIVNFRFGRSFFVALFF